MDSGACPGAEEVAELAVHVARVRNRLGHLGFERGAEASAQPQEGDPVGAGGGLGVVLGRAFDQSRPEAVEGRAVAPRVVLAGDRLECAAEDDTGPIEVEVEVGCGIRGGERVGARFEQFLEGVGGSVAGALEAAAVSKVFGEVVPEGAEKEGSEAAAAGIGLSQEAPGEELGEERLGQVLGIVWGESAAGGEGADGTPVGVAQLGKGAVGRGVVESGLMEAEDAGPAGFRERVVFHFSRRIQWVGCNGGFRAAEYWLNPRGKGVKRAGRGGTGVRRLRAGDVVGPPGGGTKQDVAGTAVVRGAQILR